MEMNLEAAYLEAACALATLSGTRWVASLLGLSNLAEDASTYAADVGDSPT